MKDRVVAASSTGKLRGVSLPDGAALFAGIPFAAAPIGTRRLRRRMGQPDDIAQVIAYLVSPLSRQVTEAEWSVDGGAQRHV